MRKLNYSKSLQRELVHMYEKLHMPLYKICKEKHIGDRKLKEILFNNNVNLKSLHTQISTQAQRDQIVDLYINQLLGCSKISKITGIPSKQINKYLQELGILRKVGHKRHSCNSKYFHAIDTPEKAY